MEALALTSGDELREQAALTPTAAIKTNKETFDATPRYDMTFPRLPVMPAYAGMIIYMSV